ncbi:ribonuclease HII, partial [Muriicola sp.]|uniref:ribonuclease HII n=1 Tax=Muriicola sp. TaxID=2020856 RepID=UPI003C7235C3
MKCFLAIGFIAILLVACTPIEKSTLSLRDAIPENAALVLKVNNLAALKRELKNNDFAQPLLSNENKQGLFHGLKGLEDLDTEAEGILVIVSALQDSLNYLFITTAQDFKISRDSISALSHSSISVQSVSMDAYHKDGSSFYTAPIANLQLVSPDSTLLASTITGIPENKPNKDLEALFKTTVAGKSATLFINSKKTDSLNSNRLDEKESSQWSDMATWFAMDLSVPQNLLQWSGVGIVQDSSETFLSLFSNTQAVVNSLATLTPEDADGLLSVSFSDYTVFAANQKKQYPNTAPNDALFQTVEEVGIAYMGTNRAMLLKTYGATALSEFLVGKRTAVYEYQGKEVGEVDKLPLLENAFPGIVKNFKITHYVILENAFVFAESKSILEMMLRNINSRSTFENSAVYNSAKTELAEASSLLFVANNKKFESVARENLPKSLIEVYDKAQFPDHVIAFQVVADRSFYHLNSFVKRKQIQRNRDAVSPLFTVQLDAPLATVPQFVTDHRNNKKEIVVQDTENNLYLISTAGKILWKKSLKGRIQGRIQQIDLYKNGRLQLAFTTNNQFLVLDRNGKEVAPFNKSFSGAALNPLAVFDYENNRNYRFVVTQGKDIQMFNGKGQSVKGFKYTKAESAVLYTPKHFRIGSKDYLVFQLEDGTLKIVNRVGNTRIKVAEKIQFSDNEVYLNNNRFIVTDKTGTLFAVDTKGKITKTRFNLNEDHGMEATSKTLSIMNDNELSIKGNKASLDLGVYTKPRIFYIYDKIYVS